MGDLRLPLTDRNVASLPPAMGAQYLARDTELPGFFVTVGVKTKSFMIQADLRKDGGRTSIRMKVGEVGDVNAREARAKAKTLLGSIASGVDPREHTRVLPVSRIGDIPTLRVAWARYKASHLERKGRSEHTIRHYEDHVERLFKDWLDISLAELGDSPALVADRHEAITSDHGPYMANGAMRSFRAIYNHARKTCRALPSENPTFGVD